jgi:hypothetical protein
MEICVLDILDTPRVEVMIIQRYGQFNRVSEVQRERQNNYANKSHNVRLVDPNHFTS